MYSKTSLAIISIFLIPRSPCDSQSRVPYTRRHNLLQASEAETEQIAPQPLTFEIETASFFSLFLFFVFVFFSLSGLFAFFKVNDALITIRISWRYEKSTHTPNG